MDKQDQTQNLLNAMAYLLWKLERQGLITTCLPEQEAEQEVAYYRHEVRKLVNNHCRFSNKAPLFEQE